MKDVSKREVTAAFGPSLVAVRKAQFGFSQKSTTSVRKVKTRSSGLKTESLFDHHKPVSDTSIKSKCC